MWKYPDKNKLSVKFVGMQMICLQEFFKFKYRNVYIFVVGFSILHVYDVRDLEKEGDW